MTKPTNLIMCVGEIYANYAKLYKSLIWKKEVHLENTPRIWVSEEEIAERLTKSYFMILYTKQQILFDWWP